MLKSLPPGATKFAGSGIPFIVPPSGTMGNNGAFTLGTALPTTYASCYMWFATGQIAAASAAGWYYTTMSSTTAATVFNNAYVAPGVPTIPSAPTAFVTTGPGAITGVTATNLTGPQISIPAGMLGPNGILRISDLWSVPGNTDTKTIGITVGGSSVRGVALNTAGQIGVPGYWTIFNRGSQAAQVAINPGAGSGDTISGGQNNFLSINFANAQTVAFTANLGTATDYIVLEGWAIEVMP